METKSLLSMAVWCVISRRVVCLDRVARTVYVTVDAQWNGVEFVIDVVGFPVTKHKVITNGYNIQYSVDLE